jgi:hypothetical protein
MSLPAEERTYALFVYDNGTRREKLIVLLTISKIAKGIIEH